MTEKKSNAMRFTAVALCGLLVWTNAWAVWPHSASSAPLNELIEEPYLLLLERADELKIPDKELEEFRKQLKAEKKATKKKMNQEAGWLASSEPGEESWGRRFPPDSVVRVLIKALKIAEVPLFSV